MTVKTKMMEFVKKMTSLKKRRSTDDDSEQEPKSTISSFAKFISKKSKKK
jgi:hypothetical protein